ncbi:hypothetical protein Ga0609869_001236 [Rhodovulum iodosum]|uniref:Lipoprotein n=1 Tax=Rhodovulum iodosum TaxID=68291 RepID=A0ABV3XS28_9RHOB|nr:hypothetical protein [Rhodovulum robiginosum]RSK32705.1 hypothetical protein EJA01_10215 [Rhodovulum robiginosum]
MFFKPALGAIALAGLSGCIDSGGAPNSGPPSVDEQACLAAVVREASNPDVTVISSQESEAGTTVRIGVGAGRAPWQCLAYPDGTTGEVMSLVDEGAL